MSYELHQGCVLDVLPTLPAASVQACMTSPPYWGLRDYGTPGQLGLERTPEEYVSRMVEVFREARRVLKDDGTLWLNLGDSYAGSWGAQSRGNVTGERSSTFDGSRTLNNRTISWDRTIKAHPHIESGTGSLKRTPELKPKDLIGIPWRVAFALQADGWYLRSDIIWHKPNPMPESVRDRPTKAHEYLFLLAKQERYFYDADAIAEPEATGSRNSSYTQGKTAHGKNRLGMGPRVDDGLRNKRSVWTIATQPFPGAHFATFPEALVTPCILAGSRIGDTILDPFAGSGTAGVVVLRHQRSFVGIELNADYVGMARRRIYDDAPLLNGTL